MTFENGSFVRVLIQDGTASKVAKLKNEGYVYCLIEYADSEAYVAKVALRPWQPNSGELVKIKQGTDGRVFKYTGMGTEKVHYMECTKDVADCCPSHNDGRKEGTVFNILSSVTFEPAALSNYPKKPALHSQAKEPEPKAESKEEPKPPCVWCSKPECVLKSFCVRCQTAYDERLAAGENDSPLAREAIKRYITGLDRQDIAARNSTLISRPAPKLDAELPCDVGPWSAEDVDYVV